MTELYDRVKTSVLMARVLGLSIGDLFSRSMLMLSLVSTLMAILFWSVIYLLFHTQLSGFAHTLIAYVPFATAEWIENIASMVLLIALFYQLVLVTVIIGMAFMVKRLVAPINDKHYHLKLKRDATPLECSVAALKSAALFLLLYLLLLPTLFIPGINVAVHLSLWALLLRGTLLPYAASGILDKQEYTKLTGDHRWGLMALFVILSLLYLIPIVGAFTAIFQLIVATHYTLSRVSELRSAAVSPS